MFKVKDKVKALTDAEKEISNKKKIESLVVLVIILIITIIAVNSIWNGDKKNSKNGMDSVSKNLAQNSNEIPSFSDNLQSDAKLDEDLEKILSSINGVGKVKVFINYSESSTLEAMYNETKKESSTEEKDMEGGIRTIQQTDTQKDVIYSEDSGNKAPVTKKVINPTIEGAIITAEGAGDSNVKANIIEAVSAVTGLAVHKVQVFKMSNN